MSAESRLDEDWRPTATIETLALRARALSEIRAHFARQGVLEVDTPVLSRTTVTEPAIDSLSTTIAGRTRYLQTSPEYHMKRLLAAGAPSIFRIGPVFRAEDAGRLHNPEFTMIEWYRLGFGLDALIDDVRAIVDLVLGAAPYRRVGYRQLLRDGAGVDPFDCDDADLDAALARAGIELVDRSAFGRRDLLDLLASHAIDALGCGRVFVVDYPSDQAALARLTVDSEGRTVAARVELVIDGIEIANGYDELVDADALRHRMETDRAVRASAGRMQPEPDERLIAAMRHGLPACAGIALGFDRLLMAKLGATRIESVLPFGDARA